ncbi:DUF1403 family protein [Aquamicrobium sp. NLF2-7]|nr:DUF1403 family protein [Aquamicrobium sp. NLF2-7]MCG8274522.1 DUF1403 family protein [Aquamicrobium sp. NLF2-7]
MTYTDATFAVGVTLKSLDDLVRVNPVWSGCWRVRRALKSAATAVRTIGRNGDEKALRDAVLPSAAGDGPSLGEKVFVAYRKLARRNLGPVDKVWHP